MTSTGIAGVYETGVAGVGIKISDGCAVLQDKPGGIERNGQCRRDVLDDLPVGSVEAGNASAEDSRWHDVASRMWRITIPSRSP
ncbi:hypothetical protein D3C73_1569630 [compost metagenome]